MRIRHVFAFAFVVALHFTFLPSTAQAADKTQVDRAVKKGVEYLQNAHKPARGYAGGSRGMGGATLSGLALLEAGVPDTDPSLEAISTYVHQNAYSEARTYELSLTIMFLDRLGKSADRPLIQLLGLRLMSGQGMSGGWGYGCGYALNADDEARMRNAFLKDSTLVSSPAKKDPAKTEPPKSVARPDLPVDPTKPPKPEVTSTTPAKKDAPAKKEEPSASKPADEPAALNHLVEKWAKQAGILGPKGPILGLGSSDGDHSNTQFATLALWCSRKHGVPCDRSLALLDTRYRACQDKDGGWGYTAITVTPSTPAMTCSGLVALSVAQGARLNVLRNAPAFPALKKDNGPKRDPNIQEDEAVKKGLQCLGNFIEDGKGPDRPEGKFGFMRRGVRLPLGGGPLLDNLYFLWSLERVGVIYGLDTIGKHDWYKWGADALIADQAADGSWSGTYPGSSDEISTCFALLFLRRANIVPDLSAVLKGKVTDPGKAVLRGGGDLPKIPLDLPVVKKNPTPEPVESNTPRPDVTPPKTDPAQQDSAFEVEANRLCSSLLNAAGDARSRTLTELKDTKGSVYTEALALASAKTSGEFQGEVREALARRLTRMTAATLREMLKDANIEVRRAAAIACGLKSDKQFTADLINRLDDPEWLVTDACRTSLRSLTTKDFGPEAGMSAAEKMKAIAVWREWWRQQK